MTFKVTQGYRKRRKSIGYTSHITFNHRSAVTSVSCTVSDILLLQCLWPWEVLQLRYGSCSYRSCTLSDWL